jgi:hypothetical protein
MITFLHFIVVFGKVLEGYGIVEVIESLGSESGNPRMEVVIKSSGEIVTVTENEVQIEL